MSVSKIQRNFQITIPAEVRKKAHLKVGDMIDFELTDEGILVKPLETIDRSQAWFWSKNWQDKERKVEEDFKSGEVASSETVDEFLDELDQK